MDLDVKMEVVEEQLNSASHHEKPAELRRAEDEATLAQLSFSNSTKPKRKRKPKKIFTAVNLLSGKVSQVCNVVFVCEFCVVYLNC